MTDLQWKSQPQKPKTNNILRDLLVVLAKAQSEIHQSGLLDVMAADRSLSLKESFSFLVCLFNSVNLTKREQKLILPTLVFRMTSSNSQMLNRRSWNKIDTRFGLYVLIYLNLQNFSFVLPQEA